MISASPPTIEDLSNLQQEVGANLLGLWMRALIAERRVQELEKELSDAKARLGEESSQDSSQETESSEEGQEEEVTSSPPV